MQIAHTVRIVVVGLFRFVWSCFSFLVFAFKILFQENTETAIFFGLCFIFYLWQQIFCTTICGKPQILQTSKGSVINFIIFSLYPLCKVYIVLVSFVIIVFFTDTNFCRLRKDFKQLLEETGYVTPGKQLDEVNFIIDMVNLSRSPYYQNT